LEDRAEWRRTSSVGDETGSWSVYQRVSSISGDGGQPGAQPYQ
jgi:hypothetical protein